MELKFEVVKVQKPQDVNIVIGQAHFIKTAEDLYNALAESVPTIKFGIAFCESSGKRLIRIEGNDEELKKVAYENALSIACGHLFFIALKDAYPINVLNRIKEISEVCTIFCATANPVEVIVGCTPLGRAFLGVVDGETPLGIEKEEDVNQRREFLRKIKYRP